MRGLVRYMGAVLLLLGATGLAGAQNIPNHVDPSVRQDTGDQPRIAALRFLTTPDFPPFNYRDATGATVGFHIDLAKAICDELQAVCTIQSWPWDQIADALAENQGDAMIGGLEINPISADRFDFSSVYLEFPGRFAGPNGASDDFDPHNLAKKTIAVRKGSRHEDFIRHFVPQAVIAGFDNEFDALGAMKAGKADFYFGDAMRASFWLDQNPDCCRFVGDAYFRSDYFGQGLAIAVPAGQDKVRDAINYALARLKQDGRMDELYWRWFPVAFY